MGRYHDAHERSLSDPEGFWKEAASLISWAEPPDRVLDSSSAPLYRWFPDAELSISFNALDRHVLAGRGDQTALIYDSPLTGAKRTFSYSELTDQVATFAGALSSLGVGPGDRVVIYMPMVPEAVIAMLACARLAAVHSVVFGGFAAPELAARIDDAEPKVVVSASCGIEPSRIVPYKPLLDQALELAEHTVSHCVILQRDQLAAQLVDGRDVDWSDLVASASPADPVEVPATDPLYILYTSGTTGRPKGIVRDIGGYAVALAWSMPNIFNIKPGDTFWAASDVGWVVGHSYIVYAPLLAGATTVLYEGKPIGTPDAGAFWRVVSEYKVNVLFTAPTTFRAIKREDPDGTHLARHDTSSLRALFMAGERLDPDTYAWAGALLGVPVVDNWWQTETGWPICANPLGLQELPLKAGSPSLPVPGYDVAVLGSDGEVLGPLEEGAIALRLPMPPGTLPTLWGDDQRYIDEYLSAFPGWYVSGDGGFKDEDGYVFVMGRTDDVINVAGHRLSTGQIEAVLAAHPAVAEAAVIGVHDPVKGQVPRGFVVLKAGAADQTAEVAAELIAQVRAVIGPIAAPRTVDVVAALPKTRSGKILRKTMRDIADGASPTVPSTIEDISVLDAMRPVLSSDAGAQSDRDS